MVNSTSITYRLKRKICCFTNKISRKLSKPDRKFTADMVYGILASRSCLLTDISDQLHETVHKANTVKRLSNHLSEGTPASAAASYFHTVKRLVPSEPVVLIDESEDPINILLFIFLSCCCILSLNFINRINLCSHYRQVPQKQYSTFNNPLHFRLISLGTLLTMNSAFSQPNNKSKISTMLGTQFKIPPALCELE